MYIHKIYSIRNENKDIKEYKNKLKTMTNTNLRRSSKLNVLALFGSLKCMENVAFSKNMGIYVASEYASISNVKKVIEQISKEEIIMPFDFLNINSNNVSFYISQALNSTGKNMLLNSEDLSLEKALEISMFDLETNEVNDILIGLVDESLDGINNYHRYINKNKEFKSLDTSAWIYLTKQRENSLAKIEMINYFKNIKDLNDYLETSNFDLFNLNYYAHEVRQNLHINSKAIKNESFFKFIQNKKAKLLHIACDRNGKVVAISINSS